METFDDDILNFSIFGTGKGEDAAKSRGQLIERKLDILESLACKVSNRRSRKWLNDRLLIELVPRLNGEEIRGLFAPPPWGDEVPLSAFCMDPFQDVDMGVEAGMVEALEKRSSRRKSPEVTDKMVALNAWRRIDRRTRDAMRRKFLPELIAAYEERVRAFIEESGERDVLMLHVPDPFQRLLLHGVCEFYNLTSITDVTTNDSKLWKPTRIRKKLGSKELTPNIRLVQFLRMAKEGTL